jgi:uncharacterized coiled-coil DUF342 family protein
MQDRDALEWLAMEVRHARQELHELVTRIRARRAEDSEPTDELRERVAAMRTRNAEVVRRCRDASAYRQELLSAARSSKQGFWTRKDRADL